MSNSAGSSISDSGFTNSSQPVFSGTAEPFANVKIFAESVRRDSPPLVGTGAGPTPPATTRSPAATPTGRRPVHGHGLGHRLGGQALQQPDDRALPVGLARALLTVDTVGPKVTQASLDPKTGKVTVVLADSLSGLASGGRPQRGQLLAHLARRQGLQGHGPDRLARLPQRPQQTVTLTFATGKNLLKGQAYVLSISAAGVTDAAGNKLDERYFVPFPGLYNKPGQDFVAAFQTNGHTVSPADPVFVPPQEGLGGRRSANLFVRKHFRR